MGQHAGTVRARRVDMVIPGHIADSTITGCPNTAATVPADYVGLSIEWSMVKVWLGANRASVITPFVNILNSLKLSSATPGRSEEHTSELQSRRDLVCRLLLEK